MSQIPPFRWTFSEPEQQQFFTLCQQIFSEAYLTNHTFVQRFESEYSRFLSGGSVVAVSSGTAALEILFEAHGLRGHEVIVPSQTFIATASALVRVGAKPVLADIDLKTLSPSISDLEKVRTPQTKAVVMVHLGGLISPAWDEIKTWCQSQGLLLLEDAAHAQGSSFQGKSAGLLGDGSAFSFHLTKTLTMGEGGVCVASSAAIFDKMISLRQFGKNKQDSLLHDSWGGNHKLTEMQGALGLIELSRSQERIKLRQAHAKIYLERLGRLPGFQVYRASNGNECGHYKQIILTDRPRLQFYRALQKEQISLSGGVYYHPLHRQPVMQTLVHGKFPQADLFADNHFCPPCYPELTGDEIHRICDVIEGAAHERA